MAVEEMVGTAPAPPSDGPAPDPGHAPSAPEESAGDPASSATQPEHPSPSSGDSRLFKNLEEAEQRYKALQGWATRTSQGLSSLGVRDFGQLQERLSLLDSLSTNPAFLEWARAQVAKETAGSDDPETRKALEIIETVATQKAQELVAPLMQHHLKQKVETTLSQLDKEFGPEWQQYKGQMFKLLQRGKQMGLYAPNVDSEFDYEFVKGLYLQAAGADPQFAANAYAKRLAAKRAAATDGTPGTPAGLVADRPARTLDEAFEQAKRQLGMA